MFFACYMLVFQFVTEMNDIQFTWSMVCRLFWPAEQNEKIAINPKRCEIVQYCIDNVNFVDVLHTILLNNGALLRKTHKTVTLNADFVCANETYTIPYRSPIKTNDTSYTRDMNLLFFFFHLYIFTSLGAFIVV